MTDDGRRYQILGVLGQGGFGRVYRARLKGPRGFVKDVAIKLLNDPDAPESVLRRFRDESRILGLIRDRAVISVDPPTRLEGRWAVVMEFVEGETLKALLRRHGPFPPSICLEVVQEVSRALDKMYTANGPDGQPLRVIHRDLKPGNIQLTPSGDLKILDFGIAWARFEMREADTTIGIGGTPGYIAPERLAGMDTSAADIFSLGVVLRKLLTGVPARHLRSEREKTSMVKDEALKLCLELSDRMTRDLPEQRPDAREVEREASGLLTRFQGQRMREWCESKVDMLTGHTEDDLIGAVLTETLDAVTSSVVGGRGLLVPSQDRQVVLTSLLTAAGTAAVMIALGTGIAGLMMMSGVGPFATERSQEDGALMNPAAVEEPAEVAPELVEIADDESEEGSAELDSIEDEAAPQSEPVQRATRPSSGPAVADTPKSDPQAASTFPVVITSFPMGVEVFVDSKLVGKTPLIGIQLTGGKRTLKLISGEDVLEESITVGRHAPTRFVWRVGEALERSY